MDYLKFIVLNQKVEAISIQRVKSRSLHQFRYKDALIFVLSYVVLMLCLLLGVKLWFEPMLFVYAV